MEVTEEIRRAVYEQECAEDGHQLHMLNAVTSTDPERAHLKSPDENRLPYISCRRCGRVWIVMPVEGWTYDDAERALYGRLRADDELARRIVRQRGARERRTKRTSP
jgi:hypothetical protein